MSTFMADALMDSLIAFARCGGEGPKEITLSTRDYLWLADDLGVWRVPVMGPTPQVVSHETGSYDGSELARKTEWRELWIGKSFVFNGPCGPVTIKEAE